MPNQFIATVFLVIACLVLLSSCSTDEDNILLSKFQIQNDNENLLHVVTDDIQLSIDSVVIPQEMTYKVGTNFETIHPLNDGLVLVDRNMSKISYVTSKGSLIWQLKSPFYGGIGYEYIGAVDISYANNEIYVEDRVNSRIDVFSTAGQYLRTVSPNVHFREFAHMKENDLIFDVADLQRGFESNTVVQRYAVLSNETRSSFVAPTNKVYNYDRIAFTTHNRFNRIDNSIQHRRPFEDTIYNISTDIDVLPIATFSFTARSEFTNLERNLNVEDIWLELDKNGWPIPLLILYSQASSMSFCTYLDHGNLYFTVHKGDETLLPATRYFVVNGTVLNAPTAYSNNNFYFQDFVSNRRKFIEALKSGSNETSTRSVDVDISDSSTDLDSIVVIWFKFL